MKVTVTFTLRSGDAIVSRADVTGEPSYVAGIANLAFVPTPEQRLTVDFPNGDWFTVYGDEGNAQVELRSKMKYYLWKEVVA